MRRPYGVVKGSAHWTTLAFGRTPGMTSESNGSPPWSAARRAATPSRTPGRGPISRLKRPARSLEEEATTVLIGDLSLGCRAFFVKRRSQDRSQQAPYRLLELEPLVSGQRRDHGSSKDMPSG